MKLEDAGKLAAAAVGALVDSGLLSGGARSEAEQRVVERLLAMKDPPDVAAAWADLHHRPKP